MARKRKPKNKKKAEKNRQKRIKKRRQRPEGRQWQKTEMWKRKQKKRKKKKKIPVNIPHILQMAMYRKNVFLHVSDIRGKLKYSSSLGVHDSTYIGRTRARAAFVPIRDLVKSFVETIKRKKLKYFILVLKYTRKKDRTALMVGLRKKKREWKLQFSGILLQNRLQFNGCRHKKRRRK